ncbi:MAG: ABC transporter ATP-binding protein [Dehalococcoidia bacterium]|nr:ABC transporter ATP-binding protein [Dehalococcoidia bacterium]
MTRPKLGLRGVRVERPGRTILAVEELDVFPGEVLAVVGPNGAGKSTLVSLLAMLERPSAGEVLFDGEAVRGGLLAYRRRMAVVFQEALLLDTTVESNVGSGLALRGVPRAERERRVRRSLGRFGIESLARRSAHTLSGGEAQRTSLARALALEPEVLLLDEPFASLDEPTRRTLIDDLDRALSETGTTAVLVSHDRSEALRLGDRVAVLIDGRLRQVGQPSEVFAAPADEEVAAFLGVETIVPGLVRSLDEGLAVVAVGGGHVEAASTLPAGSEVLVCLRPEDVVVGPAAAPTAATSARNRLSAVVRRVVNTGPQVRVELDAGFPLVALITKQSLEELGLAEGSPVVASFKATAVHLIPRHAQRGGPSA